MIGTWGYLFEANEKKNIKNTCEPSKILLPFKWTLLHPPSHVCRLYLFQLFVPILLGLPMWINEHSISMEGNVVERVAPVSARRWEAGYGLADRLCGHRLHRDHGWG